MANLSRVGVSKMISVYYKMCLVLIISTFVVACSDSDKSEPASTMHDGGSDVDASDTDLIDSTDMRPDAQAMRTDMRTDARTMDVSCGISGEYYRRLDLEVLVGCNHLKGTLALVDYFEDSIPEAASLFHIDDDLVINRAQFLKDLSDFQRLETIGRSLFLQDIPSIPKKDGLPNLRSVEGRVVFSDWPVDNLYFPKLERVGDLRIDIMPNLTSLDGLANLKKVDGDLYISCEGIDKTEMENFLQHVEVSGTIKFNGELLSN